MRTSVAVVAAIGLIAALTQASLASYVRVAHRGSTSYLAGAGESNRLTVKYRKLAFAITDTGARVTANRRCHATGAHTARCTPNKPHLGTQFLLIKVGDGDDTVTIKPARRGGQTDIDAGAGNDVIDSAATFGRPNGFLTAYYKGGSGEDRIATGGSPDSIDGGPGPDNLQSGGGNDEVFGNVFGDDEDADHLDGGAGDDLLNGWNGDDTEIGGAGNDVLGGRGEPGEAEADVDEGSDTMDGGPGDDVLSGLDDRHAVRDVLTCGPGNDRAVADQLDEVAADCEQVDRRQVEDERNPPAFVRLHLAR
jgi:Ca2+-binding RTX toxin-like protein